jgi:hypothetical protein
VTATVRPPQAPDPRAAAIAEARRRARRRRVAVATLAVAALGAIGAVLGLGSGGAGRAAHRVASAPLATTRPGMLRLLHAPYLGVACPTPNSIGCDRVGLVVQLRRRAASLAVTIAGRQIAMVRPSSGSCAPNASANAPCGAYFQGYLQPAGLSDGPLRVRPDGGRLHWIGAHPVFARVRIVARYAGGRTAATTRRVRLSPGYG